MEFEIIEKSIFHTEDEVVQFLDSELH